MARDLDILLGAGIATGGTKATLVDTRKAFEADILNGTLIKMKINKIDYYRTITDTADSTLTFATLPGTPAAAVWTVGEAIICTVTSVADGGNEHTVEAGYSGRAGSQVAALDSLTSSACWCSRMAL